MRSTKTAVKPTPSGPAILPIDADPPDTEPQMGEGSYSGTRDYQDSVTQYLETADIEKDARNAAPVDAKQARELEKAEEKGRKPALRQSKPAKAK